MPQLKIYSLDIFDKEFQSEHKAVLLFQTIGSLENKNLEIKHCFVYISEEAFAYCDELQIKFDVNDYYNIELDYKDVNFGNQRDKILCSDAYFKEITEGNHKKGVDIYLEKNEYKETTYSFNIHKDMVQIGGNNIDDLDISIGFQVNNYVKTSVKLNITRAINDFNFDDFKDKAIQVLYEDANFNEVKLSIMITPFQPTKENFIEHYGRKFFDKFTSNNSNFLE